MTVGDVTDRSAVVWARAPGEGTVTVELTAAARSGERQRFAAEATGSSDFTVKLRVAGLEPAARHAYRVAWRGESVDGEFATGPAPETAGRVRLAWSGDLGGAGRCRTTVGYPIFLALTARRPDLFLFLGDTTYADQRCPVPRNVPGADFRATDLGGFRAKHRYNRADPGLQAFFRATPVYAIWDDHEVRNDFAGPAEPLMPAGRQAFLEYWPILPPAEEPGRLYRGVRWGRLLEMFVLDTRQYRSPNVTLDGPAKTMLGTPQREWLLAALAASGATWKVVASSVPLSIPTGRDARDSWANGSTRFNRQGSETGFEHELLAIVRGLAKRRVRNVVWLVADVHRAEIIRHAPVPGLTFHELVAGPLSAGLGAPSVVDETLRPTRLFAEGGYYNFGELDVGESGLTVRIVDAAGRIRYENTFRPES